MTFSQVYRFMLPTLAVVLLFVLAMLISVLVSTYRQPLAQDPALVGAIGVESSLHDVKVTLDSLVLPEPTFSPVQVVRHQLAGLADENQAQGICQCMCFASPDNLAITGPLENFGRLVRSPPFHILADPEQVLVGKPIFVESNARILVTLVDDKSVYSFVWVLSRQTEEPHAGCWMTDAVFPHFEPSLAQPENRSI